MFRRLMAPEMNSFFIILLLLPTSQAGCSEGRSDSWWATFECYKVPVATAVTAGVLAVVAAPVVVGAIGFGSAGIAGGSLAASAMSASATASGGGVVAGGAVAILQSIGATGVGIKAATGVALVTGNIAKYFQGDCYNTEEYEEE